LLSGDDARYLEFALDLAEKAKGYTSPNPLVGAVVVRKGRILGEGWHAGPGCDHAEIAAIRDALRRKGRKAHAFESVLDAGAVRSVCAGSSMYVTLEPCCTVGRTPPCTTALVGGGFVRIVVGAIDPSPGVDGRGIQLLRAAGIPVELADGPLAHRAKRQNDGLRKSVRRGVPFVTYKYAMSLDGRVATDSGDSCWISSTESRDLVHRWRAWSDAVVVGAGTLARDDPRLTARGVECAQQPLRVVVGRRLDIRRGCALFQSADDGPVLAVVGKDLPPEVREILEGLGAETAVIPEDPSGELDPAEVCRLLAARHVQTVLLEGGPTIAGAWWRAGMIDKIAGFISPRILGGLEHRGPLLGPGAAGVHDGTGLREVEIARVGPDVLVTGYREGPF
jgi:diaminohydroxyphosphoribosylaminopyrimidine deaminase/5-amino-6-(5-phosphoribosylamino)uracil reductase